MNQRKPFWIVQNLIVVAFWLFALGCLATGHTQGWAVPIAAVVLVAHVLEVPLAFHALKGRPRSPLRVVLMTLVFGYTWWMPARRGIFAAA